MRYYPLFMSIEAQPVLVVGGGPVAERKVRLLLKAGGSVRIVARALDAALADCVNRGEAAWTAREFDPIQLDGMRLAFAATDDAELNLAVYTAAEARGIPVNVVDDRELSRFITPAMVDRHPLQVAISSGGESPVLTRRIRAWIERLLPMGLGRVVAVAGRLRHEAKALPLPQRRRFWDAQFSDENIQRWSAEPQARIAQKLQQALRKEPASAPGKVWLVGAGPGRPDLLTLRALQVLGQADVILHDRLVPPEILDLARRDAEFINVGKRQGNHHQTQEQIHALLLEHAGRGRQVVRLKGGDPFVFGRGGEELQVLRAAGIDYEVVPGVTAATACAAFAGIPLTHRDLSHALTLITGHTPPGGQEPAWAELAGPGRTLAVYMGVQQAGSLKHKLLEAGLAAHLPVALIADGTRASQVVLRGTLDELPALAARAPREAPGLLIIGAVAALADTLAWFENPISLASARQAAA